MMFFYFFSHEHNNATFFRSWWLMVCGNTIIEGVGGGEDGSDPSMMNDNFIDVDELCPLFKVLQVTQIGNSSFPFCFHETMLCFFWVLILEKLYHKGVGIEVETCSHG